MACLRDHTLAGAVVALVDADQAFDPTSASRAGVDLRRLLWVRCGGRRDVALRAADLLARCPGFALIALDVGESPPRLPLAGAFRLKLAVRRSGAALLVVGARRITGAAAALAIESARESLAWSGPGPIPTRLARMRSRLRVLRGLPGWPALPGATRSAAPSGVDRSDLPEHGPPRPGATIAAGSGALAEGQPPAPSGGIGSDRGVPGHGPAEGRPLSPPHAQSLLIEWTA
jgi:hypothetical protein